MRDQSIITPGSYCPECKHCICWYDNIPLLSYFLLGGKCRYCHAKISYLYPFIELITAIIFLLLIHLVPYEYWLAYFIFFSALIVTIRTDLEQMLISRYVTLLLVPVGWILSAIEWLPVGLYESVIGSILGYGILFCIAHIFTRLTGKIGLGQGDLEMLAFIGAFTGILGVWATLTLASTAGAIAGLAYASIFKQKKTIMIPFGPFLALGGIIYTLFQNDLFLLLVS